MEETSKLERRLAYIESFVSGMRSELALQSSATKEALDTALQAQSEASQNTTLFRNLQGDNNVVFSKQGNTLTFHLTPYRWHLNQVGHTDVRIQTGKIVTDTGAATWTTDIISITGLAAEGTYWIIMTESGGTITSSFSAVNTYPALTATQVVVAEIVVVQDPADSAFKIQSVKQLLHSDWTPGGGADFNHMFQIEVANAALGTFTVRPGVWQRNGATCISSHKHDYVFGPTLASNFKPRTLSTSYTGLFHVYCLLLDSSGAGGNMSDPVDLSNESSVYDANNDGTRGLVITGTTQLINTVNSTGQWCYLGTITYDTGAITDISQGHVGAIIDDTSDLLMYAYAGAPSFAINFLYTSAALAYAVSVTGGKWKARDQEKDVAAETAVVYTDLFWWLSASEDPSAELKDRALLPDTVTIKHAAAFPTPFEAGYTYFRKRLYELAFESVTADDSGTLVRVPYLSKIHHPGGDVRHDWVRPDGKDIGGADGWATSIDAAYPRIKSLSFNTSDVKNQAELQDNNAYEDIITAAFYMTGDLVQSYFDVDLASSTDKKYFIWDTDGNVAGHSTYHSSLEIKSKTHGQIRAFDDPDGPNNFTKPASHDAFGDQAVGYLSLLGRSADSPAKVVYVSLKDFQASSAEWAGSCYDLYDYSVVPHSELDFSTVGPGDTTGENGDHDLRYEWSYDVNATVDAKSYRTSGEHWMSGLYVSPDGTSPDQRWNADELDVNVANAVKLVAGANSYWHPDTVGTLVLDIGTPGGNHWKDVNITASGLITLDALDGGEIQSGSGSTVRLQGSSSSDLFLGDSNNKFRDIYFNGRPMTEKRIRVQDADTGLMLNLTVLGETI